MELMSEQTPKISTKSSADQSKKLAALEVLKQGGTQAAAARAANVSRSTILRWLKDNDFRSALSGSLDQDDGELAERAISGLADLVPKALDMLEEALDGENYTAAQQRVALDIIKSAASISRHAEDTGKSELAKALEELDAGNKDNDIVYD